MTLVFSHNRTIDLLERYHPVSVFEELRSGILKRVERGEDVIPHIQGRRSAKEDVMRALLSACHPYLVSVEGTGKTRLARSLTKLLGHVPRIGGCPYNDDPKWPVESLCPRCRASSDPVKEFGVEWVSGPERFSRIQGNEYMNESKLLGLKDIQAIASGMSPADPRTFTGTGVFKANRGILLVDELPAIRTKVQVLLHPIIEEKRAILEEYGWEYPLDLCVLATGNPEGFSHVNEVPRPLIDRLETIYMDLPDEEVEFDIMVRERKGARKSGEESGGDTDFGDFPVAEAAPRNALAPWWILMAVNRAARQSRSCRWVERPSSIRGTIRAVDHTYSSAEIARRPVANLEDLAAGLRLALRGRVQLRQDLVDFENPRETYAKVDELTDDLVRTALTDMAEEICASWAGEKVIEEVERMLAVPESGWAEFIAGNSPSLQARINELERMGEERYGGTRTMDDGIIAELARERGVVRDHYLASAAQFIVSLCAVKGWVSAEGREGLYVPARIGWAPDPSWH